MTDIDLRRIALEALCDVRTVRRAYEGEELRHMTKFRICKAAEKLGLEQPPASW